MSKAAIQQELSGVKVKHPRASDILANQSRDDSCFAVMFNATDPTCVKCTVRVEYQGREMSMQDLCNIFTEKLKGGSMSPSSTEAPALPATAPAAEASPAAATEAKPKTKKEKKMSKEKKERAPRSGGHRDAVLAALKNGELTMSEIVKKAKLETTVYNLVNALIDEKIVEKKKGEKGGTVYALK